MAVGQDEGVGRDHRVPKHPDARGFILRINVGQCLEHRQRRAQLPDAPGVAPHLATVLGITRCRRIGDIQDGDGIAIGHPAEQADHLAGQLRIGLRQVQVLLPQKPQIDLVQGQPLAGRLLGAG
jgi:hypothetical protein